MILRCFWLTEFLLSLEDSVCLPTPHNLPPPTKEKEKERKGINSEITQSPEAVFP